jgi:hypothetical protein
VFRIRIHYMRIRIQSLRRIGIRNPDPIPDPNPSLKLAIFFYYEIFSRFHQTKKHLKNLYKRHRLKYAICSG